jgi:hypothetical protein
MQPSNSSLGTADRGLNLPIQSRRPKLLAQLRQALRPRHYSRRHESPVPKAVRDAVVRAGLTKWGGPPCPPDPAGPPAPLVLSQTRRPQPG